MPEAKCPECYGPKFDPISKTNPVKQCLTCIGQSVDISKIEVKDDPIWRKIRKIMDKKATEMYKNLPILTHNPYTGKKIEHIADFKK
ncbi:MAG: hypothetical protein ACTSYO_07605 [Candidatus Ranarchaeia archaeon]